MAYSTRRRYPTRLVFQISINIFEKLILQLPAEETSLAKIKGGEPKILLNLNFWDPGSAAVAGYVDEQTFNARALNDLVH
jgi:hypothetical protein